MALSQRDIDEDDLISLTSISSGVFCLFFVFVFRQTVAALLIRLVIPKRATKGLEDGVV